MSISLERVTKTSLKFGIKWTTIRVIIHKKRKHGAGLILWRTANLPKLPAHWWPIPEVIRGRQQHLKTFRPHLLQSSLIQCSKTEEKTASTKSSKGKTLLILLILLILHFTYWKNTMWTEELKVGCFLHMVVFSAFFKKYIMQQSKTLLFWWFGVMLHYNLNRLM